MASLSDDNEAGGNLDKWNIWIIGVGHTSGLPTAKWFWRVAIAFECKSIIFTKSMGFYARIPKKFPLYLISVIKQVKEQVKEEHVWR